MLALTGAMFHVKREGWSSIDPHDGLSHNQRALMSRYAVLLRDVALPRHMVAPSDSDRLWARHVMDGLRGAELIPARARSVCDLGSGAGIPGIPVAIARPDLTMTLTEPRRERTAFLELVVDDLKLRNVRVHPARAEELAEEVDLCLARAFKNPTASWHVAEALLGPDGALLFWAGLETEVRVTGVKLRAFSTASLADAGPIVMMTRQ